MPKIESVQLLSSYRNIVLEIYPNLLFGKTDAFNMIIDGNWDKTDDIKYSFSYAINNIKDIYQKSFFEKYIYGLHICCPGSNFTLKTGGCESLGVTICFFSIILNKRIKNNCAFVGLMGPGGLILEIGSFEKKLHIAKKAGFNLVIAPDSNKNDIKKSINIFDENFKCIFINNIYDALDIALIENDNLEYKINNTYQKLFDYRMYINK